MDPHTLQGWTDYTRFLVTLVAVLDPFLAVPVYLTVTAGRSQEGRVHRMTSFCHNGCCPGGVGLGSGG